MDRTGLLKDDSSSPSRSSTACSDTDRLLQEEYGEKLPAKPSHSRSRKIAILHVVSWIIHATLLFTILAVFNSKLQCDEDRTYRPKSLDKVIEYEDRLFQTDVDVGNVYKNPPNPATEEAWNNLTSVGIVKINDQDLKMLGRTSYQMYDGSGYLASVSMFHQLHCLNMLRKCSYREAYPSCPDASGSLHILHCVDVLRQAIMCHGDTNILTWDFEPGFMGKPVANGTVMHSCRNFDSIYEWTKERQVYFEEISESAKNHTRDAGFDAYIPM